MNHLFKYLRENNDEIWSNWSSHWNGWPPHSVLNGSCRDFRLKAMEDVLMQKNMIHFELKAVFHQLFVSVLIGILAGKNKQHLAKRGITMIHVLSVKTAHLVWLQKHEVQASFWLLSYLETNVSNLDHVMYQESSVLSLERDVLLFFTALN